MDELEALRQKRLQQLQAQQQKEQQEVEQAQQQIQQLEMMIKQSLSKDALQRYGNIKAAHPEKAVQLLIVLGQMLQQGKITTVDDATLKNILTRLQPQKKEFKFKRI